MENKKPITSNLDVTQYDPKDFPPVLVDEPVDEQLPHIEIEYDLTADEIRSGLKAFQKQVLFKRNTLYTVLFSVVLILYLFDMIINNNRTTISYMGTILCVVVIFFVWYNPYRHREQLANALSNVDDKFTMSIYQEYIYIKEENGGFRIVYNNPKMFIIQDSEKFTIGVGKERIYIIPKRCLDAKQVEEATEIFGTLKERFHNI